jgi:hypothetical protein
MYNSYLQTGFFHITCAFLKEKFRVLGKNYLFLALDFCKNIQKIWEKYHGWPILTFEENLQF